MQSDVTRGPSPLIGAMNDWATARDVIDDIRQFQRRALRDIGQIPAKPDYAICHPETLDELVDALGDNRPSAMGLGGPVTFGGIPVRTSPYVEKDRPSGRYEMPDGSCVLPEDIRFEGRFVEYGPEDIELLLYMGVIKEDREPVIMVIPDDTSRFTMEPLRFRFSDLQDDFFRRPIITGL